MGKQGAATLLDANPDAELVRALLAGAPDAAARLYDRYAAGLHRFLVTRLAGDVPLAEEAVVETLVAAVRDVRSFDPRRGSLSAWLYGLARRRGLQELRRQRRRREVPPWAQLPLESVANEVEAADPAEVAVSRLEAQRAVAVLSQVLCDVELETLTLAAVAELSVPEIARLLGRSERAVHSILHRARRKARERLERDD